MNYSTIFAAVIVNVLVSVATYFGVTIGNEAATAAAQVLVAIGTGAWIMYQRTRLQEAPGGNGDVSMGGFRK